MSQLPAVQEFHHSLKLPQFHHHHHLLLEVDLNQELPQNLDLFHLQFLKQTLLSSHQLIKPELLLKSQCAETEPLKDQKHVMLELLFQEPNVAQLSAPTSQLELHVAMLQPSAQRDQNAERIWAVDN
jgi:hypothetical protein